MDHPAVELHRRAHGAQAGDMKVDAALADGVAARQRQPCLATPREQGAQQQDRGAHAGHQLRIDAGRLEAIGADRHREPCAVRRPVHLAAETLKQRRQDGDVERGRYVA